MNMHGDEYAERRVMWETGSMREGLATMAC